METALKWKQKKFKTIKIIKTLMSSEDKDAYCGSFSSQQDKQSLELFSAPFSAHTCTHFTALLRDNQGCVVP